MVQAAKKEDQYPLRVSGVGRHLRLAAALPLEDDSQLSNTPAELAMRSNDVRYTDKIHHGDLFVHFYRRTKYVVDSSDGERTKLEFPEIGWSTVQSSRSEAFDETIVGILEVASRMLEEFTHNLSEEDRELKGALLSLVDIFKSKIAEDVPTEVVILGAVERKGSSEYVFVRQLGNEPFEIRDSSKLSADDEHLPRYAVVEADEHGHPSGDVIELRDPIPKRDRNLKWWDDE